jgi:hypothetical protein
VAHDTFMKPRSSLKLDLAQVLSRIFSIFPWNPNGLQDGPHRRPRDESQ